MGKTFIAGHQLLIGLVLLLLIAVGYLFVLKNWVDPQPLGRLQIDRPLPILEVLAYSQQKQWLDVSIPAVPYTAILTAAHRQGELDSSYGVAIGEEDNYLEVVISPLGYVAITERVDGEVNPLRMMAPFPHVRGGAKTNEIWVTVDSPTAVTIRLNREVLWQGAIHELRGANMALVGESYGETAEIDFQWLQLFYE